MYDDLLLNPLILDITVEDPSDEFVALRDFVDCRNAMKMESFQPPKVHQPFSKELEESCRQKLKLHKVTFELFTQREREREREISASLNKFHHIASVTESVWDPETESDWSQQPWAVQGIQTHSQE